ncbi:uncharacterized protein LOC130818631 [Amaranthus tricolor]|uniref:uncharacterized protein LOC130818631 n=1 Tax=Amaranthus tricolor TaxID=29722 RepID=UPI00258CE031|nr:uncharacterized protein LOC130818631 [Amaranthus tricolor]
MNCLEVDVFVSEFKSSIQRHQPNWSSQRIEAFVQENFTNAFRTAAGQGSFDNRVNSDILKQIAEGPLKHAQSYNVCYTNGYRFHTVRHASNNSADNSGVCVKAGDNSRDEEDFYGQLLEIVEVEYPGIPIKRVTLFKCHWYDPTTTGNSRGTNIHKRYKLVDIHQGRSYRLYDPFVLASQACQVYYLPYPSTRQNLKDWRAVYKVKQNKFDKEVEQESKNAAFQEENRDRIEIEEDVSQTPLLDPSGEFVQQVHDNDEDTEEDVDLVLSEDEQSEDEDVENDDYFSDED